MLKESLSVSLWTGCNSSYTKPLISCKHTLGHSSVFSILIRNSNGKTITKHNLNTSSSNSVDWVRLTPEMVFLPFWWGQHWHSCCFIELFGRSNNFFLKTRFTVQPLDLDATRGWLATALPQQKGWIMRPILAERLIFGSCGVPSAFCFVVRDSVVSGVLSRFQSWSWEKCEMMSV